MNREMLCSWLGVTQQSWPPDPHVLLGLPPEEADLGRIEQVVHERMAKLRCYQISHPEEATEGMNRLAQAFLSLTERIAKPTAAPRTVAPVNGPRTVAQPGPRTIPPSAAAPPQVVPPPQAPPTRIQPPTPVPPLKPPSKDDTAVGRKTEVDWRHTPPPVRSVSVSDTQPSPPAHVNEPTVEIPPPAADAPSPARNADSTVVENPSEAGPLAQSSSSSSSSIEMIPAVVLLARHSPEARRGLGTLKALRERIVLTRKMLIAWKQVGRYLGSSKRQVTTTAEENDLTHRMDVLFDVLEDYPAFLGQPGQPGYRVAALARLEITAQMFKLHDAKQRQDLARDWKDGKKVLVEHRRFLLEQFKRMKRRGAGSRFWGAIRSALNDHPVLVFLGAAAVIAGVLFFFVKW